MRILFSARAIVGVSGGVERMITSVMNELAARGHHVSLVTWDTDVDGSAFYRIDDRVVWTRLQIGNPGRRASLRELGQRMAKVRNLVRKTNPDVIVGFQDGPSIAVAGYTIGMGIPVIAAERNAPSRFTYTRSGNRKYITYAAFALCSRVLVQLESYRSQYPKKLQRKIVSIPNPIIEQGVTASPEMPDESGNYTLLSVGRLSYQKNYNSLVRAFALVMNKFPNWILQIVGDGELRGDLLELSEILEIPTGRFIIKEATKDIYPQYRAAHLFCLPSLWEGFPNALGEALSCGLPSVGFGECAGVNELIRQNENGLLTDGSWTVESLALKLSELMADPARRAEMGRAAIEGVRQYNPDMIYDKWEEILVQASKR